MLSLNGKIAIVTGSSRGIGKSIAMDLAAVGADVVVTYNSKKQEALQVVDCIKKIGRRAFAVEVSVESYESAKALMARTIKEFGKIDILVNNAGVTRDSSLFMMSIDDWQEVISVNLDSVFNCSKAVIGHMLSRRVGRIINVCSISGLKGLPGQTNYSAAKAGVIGFTRSLGKELAPYGILVNAVAPGFIDTDMSEKVNSEMKDKYVENIPIKRFGQPEEVAKLVTFLASDFSSYLVGETITIDGGLSS